MRPIFTKVLFHLFGMYVSQLDFLFFLYYLEMFWTDLRSLTQYNRVLRDHRIRSTGLLEKWYLMLLQVLMVFELQ